LLNHIGWRFGLLNSVSHAHLKVSEDSGTYNESSEQAANLISIKIKIGLLISKANQVESSALLCEGSAEEAVLVVVSWDLPSLVGLRVCLAIVVVLFGLSASARLLEKVLSK
jgi:hypothetical protein